MKGGMYMLVRVHRNFPGGLYWGQVYNCKKKKWEDVTLSCITKAGTKRALKQWAKEHDCLEELEIRS